MIDIECIDGPAFILIHSYLGLFICLDKILVLIQLHLLKIGQFCLTTAAGQGKNWFL